MKKEDIEKRVNNSLKKLYEIDADLMGSDLDINERSITHRLAIYLQKDFPEYYVDCEYNRMLKEKAKNRGYDESDFYEYIKKELDIHIEGGDNEKALKKANYVIPDIIIHERKNDKNNLLAIEVKVRTKKFNKKDERKDHAKLKSMAKDLGYNYTLFLNLGSEFEEIYL